ncbi:MAG TPA: SDR family oxidoreductase [Solirubrobacteraceae bacterium]|nr:SDR family oxidoreductase [Solirubrobacteraceae bacterium]
MSTILITGANKGLGLETARRLLADGHAVWVGARDGVRGEQAAAELGGRFVQLDVTDQASVQAAAAKVEAEDGSLDVLINNAGIAGERVAVPDTTVEQLRHVYETNVFGLVRVMQAFAPLLLRSPSPVVVNVSSGMGSLTVTTDPERLESSIVGLAYPSSKTAVNMLTSQYAKAYPQMRINAVDPGYTATDLNQHRGIKTVEEGAQAIVWAARLGPDGPSGGFFDADGAVPW